MRSSASARSVALRAGLFVGIVIAVVLALTGSTAAAVPMSVTECRTLTQPGTYELAEDLIQEITGNLTSGSCLVIDSPDVILLGNDNVIMGAGSASVGVEVRAHENVTVSNLTVEGFESVGMLATGTTDFEARNLSVNATGTGLKIENGKAPTLRGVRVSNGTGDGIGVVDTANATASDILTRSNFQAGVHLRNASNATVRRLDSQADGVGVNVTNSAQVTVRNATVRSPVAQGIRAVVSPDALIADNTVRGAGMAGILVHDAPARLERNLVREGARGIIFEAANGSVSLNDTATGSLDGAGLIVEGGRDVTVRGFNATANLLGANLREADATRLDGVLTQRNDLEGVVVRASTATLTNVTARGNNGSGVRVAAGSFGSGSNLTVRGNAVGLWLQSSPDWVAEGVVAADNEGGLSLNGSAVRVTGAPGTIDRLTMVNGAPDVGNRTLDLRARGIALAADTPPDAPAAHRYLGSALGVQNVSGGASAWVNASAAWSPDEVDAYQAEEPRWQRWNGSAWKPVSGFNRAFSTDRRVVANATEFGVLAPLVRDDVTQPDATVRVNGTRGDNGWWVTLPEVRVSATDAYAGVASRELRVGGNWTPVTDPVTLDEGETVVRGRATDLAGNLELTDNRTVRVDVEPPRTNATAPTGWVNRTANVTLRASDAISGVDRTTWGLDDGDLRLYEGPVSVESEGEHEIRYRSRDIAGIRERVRNVTVRVDRTAPAVAASVSGTQTSDGEFVNSATVAVNASDALAGLNLTRVRVDDGPWRAYDGPVRVNETGSHTVTAEATDLAGNRELGMVEFTVANREPPSTRLVAEPSTPDGNNGWYRTRPEFRLEPMPEDATPEYRIDDGEFQTYETPVQVPEGTYTIAYRSTHPTRPDESVNETQFRVDTDPPRTTATAPTGWVNRTANVTLTASDVTSGVDRTTWRLDDGDPRVYEGTVRVESEGVTEIRYRSQDRAGNLERERNVTVRIDRTAPVVEASVSGNRTGDGELAGTARVVVNASDALAGLNLTRVRVDDGPWRTYDGPVRVNEGGTHTVTAEATDRAGNREPAVVEFTVVCPDGEVYRDGTCEPAAEPRVEVRTQSTDTDTVSVAVENITDDGARLVVVHPDGREEPIDTVRTDGGEEPTSAGRSTTWNTTGLENGRYRIEARNDTNVTVASTSYLIERARVSAEQATFAVGIGVVLSAIVQAFSVFGQSFSVLGQSMTGLSGRAVRFVDLAARVIRRILSIEYREYTKDTAAIRRIRQTVAVGVAAAALASASTLADLQPWTLPGFLSNLPILGGAALVFSAIWYGGDWLVGQLIDEDPKYVLLGSGLVSLLATTILFRSPFGSPGYVDRSGDTPPPDGAREREKAVRALADLGLVAVAALVFLPAMRLWIYGFGETGLLLVVMTLATGSVPVPPLPNYRVWRWNKPVGLFVFALGLSLYVGWQLAVLPDPLVIGIGVAGVVTAGGFVTRVRRRRNPNPDKSEDDLDSTEADSD